MLNNVETTERNEPKRKHIQNDEKTRTWKGTKKAMTWKEKKKNDDVESDKKRISKVTKLQNKNYVERQKLRRKNYPVLNTTGLPPHIRHIRSPTQFSKPPTNHTIPEFCLFVRVLGRVDSKVNLRPTIPELINVETTERNEMKRYKATKKRGLGKGRKTTSKETKNDFESSKGTKHVICQLSFVSLKYLKCLKYLKYLKYLKSSKVSEVL